MRHPTTLTTSPDPLQVPHLLLLTPASALGRHGFGCQASPRQALQHDGSSALSQLPQLPLGNVAVPALLQPCRSPALLSPSTTPSRFQIGQLAPRDLLKPQSGVLVTSAHALAFGEETTSYAKNLGSSGVLLLQDQLCHQIRPFLPEAVQTPQEPGGEHIFEHQTLQLLKSSLGFVQLAPQFGDAAVAAGAAGAVSGARIRFRLVGRRSVVKLQWRQWIFGQNADALFRQRWRRGRALLTQEGLDERLASQVAPQLWLLQLKSGAFRESLCRSECAFEGPKLRVVQASSAHVSQKVGTRAPALQWRSDRFPPTPALRQRRDGTGVELVAETHVAQDLLEQRVAGDDLVRA
eukprot:scaffold596_cov236-Pinguiococcus_pyrenoidosus.AAC.7